MIDNIAIEENKILKNYHVGDYEITDMNKYLDCLSKGLSDKLFFLNSVNLDILIDFGSADGVILNYISKVKPNLKLIGYDIDKRMINISKNKYSHIQFESNWFEVERIIIDNKHLRIGILISSVIHEIYSYSNSKQIKFFWEKQIFNNNIDYVIIRDMMPLDKYNKITFSEIDKIRERSDKDKLNDFENKWGSINNNYRTLLHWLLKYKYVINWSREVYENYLPITLEFLKNKCIPLGWNIEFEDHYLYYYIKNLIKTDFDVDLVEPTHLKMIIKNIKK